MWFWPYLSVNFTKIIVWIVDYLQKIYLLVSITYFSVIVIFRIYHIEKSITVFLKKIIPNDLVSNHTKHSISFEIFTKSYDKIEYRWQKLDANTLAFYSLSPTNFSNLLHSFFLFIFSISKCMVVSTFFGIQLVVFLILLA